MPVLNDSDREAMRRWARECSACRATIKRWYCRQCDEFFEVGHAPECRAFGHEPQAHDGHRIDRGTMDQGVGS